MLRFWFIMLECQKTGFLFRFKYPTQKYPCIKKITTRYLGMQTFVISSARQMSRRNSGKLRCLMEMGHNYINKKIFLIVLLLLDLIVMLHC